MALPELDDQPQACVTRPPVSSAERQEVGNPQRVTLLSPLSQRDFSVGIYKTLSVKCEKVPGTRKNTASTQMNSKASALTPHGECALPLGRKGKALLGLHLLLTDCPACSRGRQRRSSCAPAGLTSCCPAPGPVNTCHLALTRCTFNKVAERDSRREY